VDLAPTTSSRDLVTAGPASPADVEWVIARYVEGLRSQGRTARSVAAVMDRLRVMDERRARRLGRRRAGRLLASSVFQGVVQMAASALSAVGAGLGAAAGQAASGAGRAASGAGRAASAARIGSQVMARAAPHLDPARHAAGRLDLAREAARASADEQEGFVSDASDHVRTIRHLEQRALEIMDRCAAAADAGARTALCRP
jgi:hypothetical protein